MDTNKAIQDYIKHTAESGEAKRDNHNIVQKGDSSNRMYEMRNGWRINGPRKTKLINQVNLHMAELGKKGVHVRRVLTHLGITGDVLTYTTKQWTGVMSKIAAFRKDNNI